MWNANDLPLHLLVIDVYFFECVYIYVHLYILVSPISVLNLSYLLRHLLYSQGL